MELKARLATTSGPRKLKITACASVCAALHNQSGVGRVGLLDENDGTSARATYRAALVDQDGMSRRCMIAKQKSPTDLTARGRSLICKLAVRRGSRQMELQIAAAEDAID